MPTYRYDSRDNPFDTTRGSRINLALAFSGGALGGTIDMVKPTLGYTRFMRLSRKSSFSFNVEGGYIKPFGDLSDCGLSYDDLDRDINQLCIPTSERFLVGGETSVRGFRYGTLGPYENYPNFGLRPVGGYSYHTYNFEYIYRVNDPIRLVLFADAGRAYAYKEKLDFARLRYSVGAEMRVFLPVFQFPLRFIYAMNPRSEDGDEFEGFQFTIGNTF